MVLNDRPYNWQADNKPIEAIARSVPGSAQCGYTAFAVALSASTAASDTWIYQLGEWLEKPGPVRSYVLEQIGQAERGQRLGAYQAAYYSVLRYMREHKTFHADFFRVEGRGTLAEVQSALDDGFCLFLSTMLTGYGHFITVLGYDGETLICHDPAGDFSRGYFNAYGAYVRYDARGMADRLTPAGYPWFRGFRFIAIKPGAGS